LTFRFARADDRIGDDVIVWLHGPRPKSVPSDGAAGFGPMP
jgi:hypothetical protein